MSNSLLRRRLARNTALFALTLIAGCATARPGPSTYPTPAAAPAITPSPPTSRVSGSVTAAEGQRPAAEDGAPGAAEGAITPRVKIQLYVMSKCPFAVMALQELKRSLDQLGEAVDLQLEYIATDTHGSLRSLHGEPEVKGDIVQLCAKKLYPDRKRWLSFVDCQLRSWQSIPEGWEACADQSRMDRSRLKLCLDGNEGQALLRASLKRAEAANAAGSPTIIIDGAAYEGGRSERDFSRAVCASLKGSRPAVCASMPEDVAVHAIVINDKRCKSCPVEGLIANLKGRFFSKLELRSLDYSEPGGKWLFRDLGLKRLPAILFEPDVEKAERYSSISRWMEEVRSRKTGGVYKQLKVPADFDPNAEICDNGIDDTGDGRVDCADATCKKDLLCRPEKRLRLEVFVMSQCPFAARALLAMKEVLKNFGGKLDFELHYIATEKDGGFDSLHGQGEVDEDIRQLCVRKHYGKGAAYLDYLWCRSEDPRASGWEQCARRGIVARVVEACASGAEGKRLLARDLKEAVALKIVGSPTWLVNNRHKFNGISAEEIKQNVCEHNPGLAGCANKLSDESKTNQGSCGQ